MVQTTITFSEIEKMLDHFPQPPKECIGCNTSLSSLDRVIQHLALWQTNEPGSFKIDRPRQCLFAASHGCSMNSVEEVSSWLAQSATGDGLVNKLCQLADAELRVYELDIENPSQDFKKAPAMTEAQAAHAITYGMMAVEPGLDLIIIGTVGGGSNQAAQAILNNIQSIQRPISALQTYGGYDLCAMVGAAIAARMAGIPVLIDSVEGDVIKILLHKMKKGAGDHLYLIDQTVFPAPHYRAVAAIPSLKAHLIIQTSSRDDKTECCKRKIS